MRLTTAAAFLALAAPAGYFGFTFLIELRERVELRKAHETAVTQAARSVLDATGLRFEQVVLGPGEAEHELRFRARVAFNGEESARSAYGVIDKTCAGEPAPPSDSSCWTVAELVIDGAPAYQSLAPGLAAPIAAALETTPPLVTQAPVEEPLAIAPATTPAPVEKAPPLVEAAEVPATEAAEAANVEGAEPAAVEPAPRPEPPVDVAAEASDGPEGPAPDELAEIELAEAPIASHVVERSLVNARSGPSLEDAVEAQIAGGVALQLLEEDRRWGRFRVLDGDQTGLEAWIAFSVVTAR